MDKYIDKLTGILKRLLNVCTLGSSITIVFLIISLVIEKNLSRSEGDLFESLILTLLGIAVFNYIVFKKITLWHKNIKG
jgi:hypothetical protein